MSHHGDISRKLFTLGVNSIIETCGVTSLDVSDQIKFRLCVTVYKSVHGMAPGRLVICNSCPGQFLYFKDDVTCVLLVSAILTFFVSDVPLTERLSPFIQKVQTLKNN